MGPPNNKEKAKKKIHPGEMSEFPKANKKRK